MIKYRKIVSGGSNKPSTIQPATPNSQEGKALIFQRALNACRWKGENERVKIRGTNTRGNVIEIIYDKDQVTWTRGKPHFVRVKFDDGRVLMCHPSQLKYSKL